MPTNDSFPGVWNSGSDAIIANGKLYVSEEEILDGTFPQETVGSVGVFDINPDNMSLSWIKRLYFGSGDGIPRGYGSSHGSSVAKSDGKEFFNVVSYTSNHTLKIDTETDTVVKFWDESDGLSAPHGGFAAGFLTFVLFVRLLYVSTLWDEIGLFATDSHSILCYLSMHNDNKFTSNCILKR